MEHTKKLEKRLIFEKKAFIRRQRKINNTYRITWEKLGTGIYGYVKKAIHKKTKQERPIKFISKKQIPSLEGYREALKSIRGLDHPNIVKLYEWYEDKNFVYFVTELCEGDPFLEKLSETKNFSEQLCAIYFKDILSVIYQFHRRNLFHCDINPGNFMLEFSSAEEDDSLHEYDIKLIDFGLHKTHDFHQRAAMGGGGGGGKLRQQETVFGGGEEEEEGPEQEDMDESEEDDEDSKMNKVNNAMFIAPEVISGDCTLKGDMWSAGVMLFLLLSGTLPFSGTTEQEILAQVKTMVYNFDDEVWDSISADAKDLVKRLIAPKNERFTVEEAINHRWIKNLSQISKKDLGDLHIKQLRNFAGSQALKKAMLEAIATQLSSKEIGALTDAFKKMDENGDGKLSFAEFKEGLKSMKDEEEIKEIMDSIDTDKSGFVDYTEFIAATMNENIFLQKEKMWPTFTFFDKVKNT